VEPQPGDFFLAPISGHVGLGVRFGQFLNGEGFLPYQHAGVLLNSSGTTIEAMPGGAIYGHLDKWKPEELIWSTGIIELTSPQRADICRRGYHLQGVPYSFLDYLALAAHRFRVRVPGLKNYIASSGHMICSQLVDHLYDSAGKHLFFDGRWDGYVSPASLYWLLEEEKNYQLSQGI
jgi:hypothetical protein